MPQYDDDDFDQQEEFEQQNQQQRENPLRHLRKENKDLKKELDEAKAAIAKFAEQSRVNTLKDTLKELKLPEKVSALFPSDKDATPENVKAWVQEFGDVFGVKVEEEAPGQKGPEGVPDIPQEALQAWQRTQVQESSRGAVPADVEQQQIAALQAMDAAAQSYDEFVAFLRGDKKLPTA